MRNPTDMMLDILKSKTAQKIIDWVSPIYGESYVGLWIYEVVGLVLDEVVDIAEKLKTEANPLTAEWLLDYWEDYYRLPTNPSLTTAQRQGRIANHIWMRGPLNPVVLADAVSVALGGVKVDIEENVSKNTFLVNVREVINNLEPAIAVLNVRKPAHLIYQIRVATQTVANTEIKTAVAITHSQKYRIEVMQ